MKTTSRERATTARRASAPTPHILIADADCDSRALYRDSFGICGWDVMEASDGRDAIVKALMQPPALVITELTLPFIDGYALCELLRRDRTTADVPILVVTTEARPAQISRARRVGADVVLIKPAAANTLLTEVWRLVGQSGDALLGGSIPKRSLSKSFLRSSTTTPPATPPQLTCASCDRPLAYERSEIGGVSARHPEQWDYYKCATCGRFQYRQRTHTLRHMS